MRILTLTNFYQTNSTGGEETSCLHIVEGLKRRGHAVLVLTSRAEAGAEEVDGVSRSLYLEMDLVPLRHSLDFFFRRRAREQRNLQRLEQVIESFRPDVIFVWGMWNLHRSLAVLAETLCPNRVVYRFATYWPTLPSQHELYWRAPGRTPVSRLAKRGLGWVALKLLASEGHSLPLSFKHAICVSAAMRQGLVDAGVPVAHAQVIHTGVDVEPYMDRLDENPTAPNPSELRLLYAGRLAVEKGIDTAVRAVERLVFAEGIRHIRLSVAGSDWAGYEYALRQLVTQAGLEEFVDFLGHVPREAMPQLLQKFDVLLVPSRWAEPFSRMVLEGMAAGLVLVATATGGTIEILSDGENGLLFPPDDVDALARIIVSLATDPKLRRKLALGGRRTVIERFSWTAMMDVIEHYLQDVACPQPVPGCPESRFEQLPAAPT